MHIYIHTHVNGSQQGWHTLFVSLCWTVLPPCRGSRYPVSPIARFCFALLVSFCVVLKNPVAPRGLVRVLGVVALCRSLGVPVRLLPL